MKKKLSIILILFAISLVGCGQNDATNNDNSNFSINQNINSVNKNTNINSPAISVSPDTYDLGEVVYGDVASHTFTINNIGTQDLEILKLSTSCGCTKASMAEEDKIIEPGESVEMLVTFDPAVHKDDSNPGKLTRTVYIKTNDTQNPETEVTIEANVVK